MKKIFLVACLCALYTIIGVEKPQAIEFKVKGEWLMSFVGGQSELLKQKRHGSQKDNLVQDHFTAAQRIRLQLEAVASENLSATVQFQLGMTTWGKAANGGALGSDGTNIRVRQAFIDWIWPEIDMKTRMGVQYLTLPNKAGGPAILGTRVAAIVNSFQLNENLGITAFWARPYNDNYDGYTKDGISNYNQNYLDNLDLFTLAVNLKYDGFEMTPWAMYGIKGRNTIWSEGSVPHMINPGSAGNPIYTLHPYPALMDRNPADPYTNRATNKTYGSMFWVGLPLSITAFDPWNIEFDLNYGYVESMGRYDAYKGKVAPENLKRSSTQRQGWIARGLIEYKFDWGIPGILGWYASGDDSNPKNGSERIPSVAPYGTFTTFLGDTGYTLGTWHDSSLDYSGTWGLGIQIKDISFIKDLKHTLRGVWWGGTNSPSMVKYMDTAYAWNNGWQNFDGPYLTTEDGLLELNMVNIYQMYDNFKIYGELGYIANFVDNDTWNKAGDRNSTFQKQDAWKVQMSFMYSF